MALRSMRDIIAVLERNGRLRRIGKTVDRAWEPACLAKWMFQALPDQQRFGLLFDSVAGSTMPLATALLGASVETYATALGVAPSQINDTWIQALLHPRPPVTVATALCQQAVRLGAEARLGDLPIPVWTPGKDAGPYLTTNTVTRDADGRQGLGVYRTQVRDDHAVMVNLNPNRQATIRVNSWLSRGQPAPIAWVIAAEPAVHLAAVANLPYGTDEIEVAGGLAGEPIAMVRCKTIDLMVPANAEIVIEGEIHPGEMDDEGPFGEFAGYMGPRERKPVARITAITHRHDPLFYGYTSQMPPSESTVLQSLSNAGVLMKQLRHDLGQDGIHDLTIDLTFGGLLGHGVVAVTPRHPGHGRHIGRLLAEISPLKRITVVDADVDIRDPVHLEWAMNSHFNPARDTLIIDNVFFPANMDPSLGTVAPGTAAGSKIICDATRKPGCGAGTFSLPPREMMMRARALWTELGLPDFATPERARLRIDRP